MNTSNVGIYVRVSTEEQAMNGHSIKAQIDRLTQYCQAMNLNIYKIYADEGVSGGIHLDKRKAGKDLANDIKLKKVNCVVSFSLSRLFRDVVDGLTNIRQWDSKGVSVVLLDVGGSCLDTSSAMGKMMISVLLACNELERNVTGERVSLVHQNKKDNHKVWTKCVYGYDRSDDSIVKNDKEQLVIQKMRDLRTSGLSYQKIANTLNEDGIPTKENKTWYAITVSKILNNSINQVA